MPRQGLAGSDINTVGSMPMHQELGRASNFSRLIGRTLYDRHAAAHKRPPARDTNALLRRDGIGMIEINEQVSVPSSPQTVWTLLSDPRAVVDCVPGAALGEQQEDGSYDATLVVKFGPAKVTFKARVAVEFDAASMSGQVSARGRDNQGGTRVRASMNFRVTEQPEPAGSAILIGANVEIAGRLASLVEGGAALVAKRMTGEFSERLAARCAAADAA